MAFHQRGPAMSGNLSDAQLARLFDAIRKIKGSGLKQSEVDAVKAALAAETTVPQTGRKISAKGIALIHEFETLKLTSYKDPGSRNGLPITNGWGTTVDENGAAIPLGAVWTREKADRLFERDIAKFSKEVEKAIGSAPTTQNQFDALVSFHYNTGKIGTATLTKEHIARNYAAAAAEFNKWIYNDGKPLNGLIRRRAAEAALYKS
jgi:lysozyme